VLEHEADVAPFLERLDDEQRAAFLEAYRAEIERAYPPAADGKVLMPAQAQAVLPARADGRRSESLDV
jgi:trans-aconitate 2-methyltransferase